LRDLRLNHDLRIGCIRLVLLALTAMLFAAPPALAAEPVYPDLTGRVVDQADIIPADVEASLDAKLADLETKTGDQFVVVTLASLQGYEIADFGYQLGRHWAIGQKDKNNGLLLIVAPAEHDVRFEVGYGLEGTLTDALTRVIIETAIIPRFRANDYPGGIVRGVDDAIQVLSGDATEIQKLADKRAEEPGFWAGVAPILIIIVIFIIISSLRRRGRRGPWGWVIPAGGASWGSGSSSGWGGGGSGGGGFSGGGGSFGGGGSSGHW
jgi:uncharacterized protein